MTPPITISPRFSYADLEMSERYPAWRATLDAAMLECVRKHKLAVEELTERQTADALRQAIVCGDFQKLVTPDGSQAVTYMPFRSEQQMRSRIRKLEKLMKEHGIEETDEED